MSRSHVSAFFATETNYDYFQMQFCIFIHPAETIEWQCRCSNVITYRNSWTLLS